ncbi:MAG: hypothetical protein U1F52_15900 [Burkholderiales bacterium]
MLGRLMADVRRLVWLVRVMRRRGYSLPAIVACHVPVTVAGRAYGKLARTLNARGPLRAINRARFAAFQDAHRDRLGGHYYVIVMPGTLHFLRPCLDRLPGHLAVFLVSNGARPWERARLRAEYAHLPMAVLATLPGSSLVHGDAINLMLDHNASDFGILDHDLYLFDPAIFERARPAADECAFALFSEVSRRTGRRYPETYFLHFNRAVLRALSDRYGIDARLYRRAPPRAAARLASLGRPESLLRKDTQDFLDTLQLLFALAEVDGVPVRIDTAADDADAVHVGGTSMGTHRTKELAQLYVHRRFIDLAGDAEITRRYAHVTEPLATAAEIRARMHPSLEEWRIADRVDRLIERLQAARCVS